MNDTTIRNWFATFAVILGAGCGAYTAKGFQITATFCGLLAILSFILFLSHGE